MLRSSKILPTFPTKMLSSGEMERTNIGLAIGWTAWKQLRISTI